MLDWVGEDIDIDLEEIEEIDPSLEEYRAIGDHWLCFDAFARTIALHYGPGWTVSHTARDEETWLRMMGEYAYLIPPVEWPYDLRLCSTIQIPEKFRQKCHQNLRTYQPGEQLDQVYTIDLQVPKCPKTDVWPPLDRRDPADSDHQ